MSQNSEKREFRSWNDYRAFSDRIRRQNRFILSDCDREFLASVIDTIPERSGVLQPGRVFYRAQIGCDYHPVYSEDGEYLHDEESAFGPTRMKPLTDRAREGRANPSGVPVLYVATSIETAISEVRPWIGQKVSVARCKILRPLKTLDLSEGHGKAPATAAVWRHMFYGAEISAAETTEAVWIDIDKAFSRPVSDADERADYVPTQILAELFRGEGYDALSYKSQFGGDEENGGFNVVIFDVDAVEIISAAPYDVTSLKVGYEQSGNDYFIKN